ncbi:hypothetical protein BBJ28_00021655 [Nothophytophthora sp. Chile5]|nr:hypothetical protein BBJ28_00021655 [Nothophytophthora sp. Chile5]
MPAFQQQSIVDFTTTESASATQQQLLAAHNGRGFCDEAVVTVLEAYLAEQVQNSTVDIDADLALLKLYLVYPSTADADHVAKVLVKGIMAMPSTFFTGATTMLPDSIREDVTYATTVPGFLESVRAFILDAIRRSHSAIATDVFKAKLNVSDKEVADIVAAENWTVAGDVIQISANEDNQMQAKKIQENIEFQDVLKVIHTLSR